MGRITKIDDSQLQVQFCSTFQLGLGDGGAPCSEETWSSDMANGKLEKTTCLPLPTKYAQQNPM